MLSKFDLFPTFVIWLNITTNRCTCRNRTVTTHSLYIIDGTCQTWSSYLITISMQGTHIPWFCLWLNWPLTTLDDMHLVTAIYIYKIKFQIEMLLAMCIMKVISIHFLCSQCTKSLGLHRLFNKTKLFKFVNFVTDCQGCSSVQRVCITLPSIDLEKLKLIP